MASGIDQWLRDRWIHSYPPGDCHRSGADTNYPGTKTAVMIWRDGVGPSQEARQHKIQIHSRDSPCDSRACCLSMGFCPTGYSLFIEKLKYESMPAPGGIGVSNGISNGPANQETGLEPSSRDPGPVLSWEMGPGKSYLIPL